MCKKSTPEWKYRKTAGHTQEREKKNKQNQTQPCCKK